MSGEIEIFHHIGLIGSDMSGLIARYEALGFSFTPISLPSIVLKPGGEPESLGVGNRCAIFSDTYLEVLGVVDTARWGSLNKERLGPYNIDRPLARYEGLHVVHFATDDIAATRARLLGEEVRCSEVRPFQRMVDTPDGAKLMHAKTMYFLDGDDLPSLTQIAQHETPEMIFQPRYMAHRNEATSITEVIICADRPEELAGRYARYTGHRVAKRGNFHSVELGRSRIVVVAPDKLGTVIPGAEPPVLPYVAGFTVATFSVEKAAGLLRDARIPFAVQDGRMIVAARDAFGSAVLFEAEGTQRR